VGVDQRGAASQGWTVADSLEELAQLADTAGLRVVGTTHQKLDHPNPKTYVGSGKINEIARAVEASGAETVVFDGTSLFRPLSFSASPCLSPDVMAPQWRPHGQPPLYKKTCQYRNNPSPSESSV
jgi:hypothetical protein